MKLNVKRSWAVRLSLFPLACSLVLPVPLALAAPVSKPISQVLREPLPPEELALSSGGQQFIVTSPTFTYWVDMKSGAIAGLRVGAGGDVLIAGSRPLDLHLDDLAFSSNLACTVSVVTNSKEKVVLRCDGVLRDPAKKLADLDCSLLHTFYNDGVLVTGVKLRPRKDVAIQRALVMQSDTEGAFTHYLHKRRDENGDGAVRGPLPAAGQAVRFDTLTSCLQLFSTRATLAMFTDGGSTDMSGSNASSAVVETRAKDSHHAQVLLSQYLVRVGDGGKPYTLKAGEEFAFRVGLSVAPNRMAPARLHDLRMFAWIGDTNYPYATDREIEQVAQAGYTLFQMHRLGNPGEPRPPAGELERVIKKVHETGMLFLWTENADLMYDSAPGVQELKKKGQWKLWEGFNYGGRYKAHMDPYCDLAATCLASPNGLAEYRLATIRRMLDRFDVDGMYLDDDLAYANCTLWREHGHPRPVYDCLIELHEINWARRQLLRSKHPYAFLVCHSTKAIILPVLCDFDGVLYGEGYSFGSIENYRDYYQPVAAIPAQSMIWPGGLDRQRCAASVAYNYDLLTGGGQYCHIDWRMFTNKFPYGAGVTPEEHLYVETYNRAQYYFGLYESQPFFFYDVTPAFMTSEPQTYGAVYRNRTWNDLLIALANMARERKTTTLKLVERTRVGIQPEQNYLCFSPDSRAARRIRGAELSEIVATGLPAESLLLNYLRPIPETGAFHVWGGKRLSETWAPAERKLTVELQGPIRLKDTVFLSPVGGSIRQVLVSGKPAAFYHDPAQDLVHGEVEFTARPVRIEVFCAGKESSTLPERSVPPSALAKQ